MKSYWIFLAGVIPLTLAACGGSSGSSSPPPPPAHDEWTWAAGSPGTVFQQGIYGTMGVGSAGDTPGSRVKPSSWTDASGNLWLFGGYGVSQTHSAQGDLNDLWEYSSGKWTWMGGSPGIEAKGVYGTMGVPDAANVPGARWYAVTWTDLYGNLWLFGGLGIDFVGTRGDLNDLWKYSGGQWTWMGGSDSAIQAFVMCSGVYGMKGAAAPENWPGARTDEMTWSDASGNLWLFGGEGCDANGNFGPLNDLWKYSAGEWTWVSGSNSRNPPLPNNGIYGTRGAASLNNMPGSRGDGATWTDAAGNLWLFGGEGSDDANVGLCDTTPAPCLLNDLWEYSPSLNEWTWVGGSNVIDAPGVYGTIGTPAPGNFPGARWLAVSWIDAEGTVWLFGGEATDSKGALPFELNDLWKYSGGQWTWMSGSNLASGDPLGVYGTLGLPSADNVPNQRDSAVGWIDRSGNLWLFGGDDEFCCAYGGSFNDLWEYQP